MAALQVLVNGTWGSACAYGPPGDLQAATVICKELGLGSHGYLYNDTRYAGYASSPPAWIGNMTCTGKESKLEECEIEHSSPQGGSYGCQPKIISCTGTPRGKKNVTGCTLEWA
jgi:hypothetical protein